jgi:hypothetical protein
MKARNAQPFVLQWLVVGMFSENRKLIYMPNLLPLLIGHQAHLQVAV